MKVALYIPVGKIYGGAERRLMRIFSELANKGRNIDLILLGSEADIAKIIKNEAYGCRGTIIKKHSIWDVIKHVLSYRYDWIWFFNVDKCSLFLTPIAWLIGMKRLMTIANYYYSIDSFERKSVKRAFDFSTVFANHIDCLYADGVDRLKIKFPKKCITQTPMPFTNLDLFSPEKKEKCIVFASRLIKIKNPILFLESIKDIKEEIIKHNYTVLICGDGELRDEVVEFIKQNELSDIVQFKGFMKMQEILPFSTIFASLQLLENYPSQVLLEAIASGNYIVLSDVGKSKSLITDEFGTAVPLVREKITNEICVAMDYIDNNSENVINSARKFAVENFNILRSVDYFDAILFSSENHV